MEEPPRPKEQPILPAACSVWLVFIGLVMAAGTLGVIVWAEQRVRRRPSPTRWAS